MKKLFKKDFYYFGNGIIFRILFREDFYYFSSGIGIQKIFLMFHGLFFASPDLATMFFFVIFEFDQRSSQLIEGGSSFARFGNFIFCVAKCFKDKIYDNI